jgi:hypothetical protein
MPTGNAQNVKTRSLKKVNLLRLEEGLPSSSIFRTKNLRLSHALVASLLKFTKLKQAHSGMFLISSEIDNGHGAGACNILNFL